MGKSKKTDKSFKSEGLLNQIAREDSVSTKSRPKVRLTQVTRHSSLYECLWSQLKRKNHADNDFIEDKLSAKILEQARSQLNELAPKSKKPQVSFIFMLIDLLLIVLFA